MWLNIKRYGSKFYDRPIKFCTKRGLRPYSDAYWECAIRFWHHHYHNSSPSSSKSKLKLKPVLWCLLFSKSLLFLWSTYQESFIHSLWHLFHLLLKMVHLPTLPRRLHLPDGAKKWPTSKCWIEYDSINNLITISTWPHTVPDLKLHRLKGMKFIFNRQWWTPGWKYTGCRDSGYQDIVALIICHGLRIS